MLPFIDYLRQRITSGGFSTEDTLVTMLPLIRQVIETHRIGKVAPLDGHDLLKIDENKIWFDASSQLKPKHNWSEVHRILAAQNKSAVEVVGARKSSFEVGDTERENKDLTIADGQAMERPTFFPDYRTWEHVIDHHDPLTDIFSLGMLLASLACGLDFSSRTDLERFVEHRKNLFELQENLHPVIVQAISRMTDLNRHKRTQDLMSILRSLENYRDQKVDIEVDLARIKGFQTQDDRSKQFVLLSTLRNRLFEITRRNRLLHFRPTMQTVNLTQASIPLSFDIENIRPDQLVTWNKAFANTVLRCKPVSLNQFLNFSEAIYLPHILQRTISEARRDAAEYGFAQLRLVIGFLRWANFKEQPIEQYESPLILLPVTLKKKRGIQDTFMLEATTTEAEINPVVRHQFRQLYGIELPEAIDLSETTVDDFYEYLVQQIEANGTGVNLTKIDKPRISLIYEKAKRKLDQYRRKARLSGRGIRSFLDIDYSYDPANYHPLGIKLFANKVRTPTAKLNAILEAQPSPHQYMVGKSDEDSSAVSTGPGSKDGASPTEIEKAKVFYNQEQKSDNPYDWEFDLCNVTLSNFKYRRMSLVRDYDQLLDTPQENSAFEATFSLSPRPLAEHGLHATALEDRFHVVPCDPTQGMAIQQARQDVSYIIQGPPGTGKSQTITNLIADYVARGKRVLFVCEKRAAIDVVYARLKQCGLAPLCCLIHDSQADKKSFVMNMKDTYESFLGNKSKRRNAKKKREDILQALGRDLKPLEDFDDWMKKEPTDAGMRIRQLLDRCIELQSVTPELTALQREQLPDYGDWLEHQESLDAFRDQIGHYVESEVLSEHPLGILSHELSYVDQPAQFVDRKIEAILYPLERLHRTLRESKIDESYWGSLAEVQQLLDYVRWMKPILTSNQIALLNPDSARAVQFAKDVREFRQHKESLEQLKSATTNWTNKLPAGELTTAIEQAKALEGSFLSLFKPTWWQLRSVLNRSYDFKAHAIRPKWSQVLEQLQAEYNGADKLEAVKQALAEDYQIAEHADDFIETVNELSDQADTWPTQIQSLHRELIDKQDSSGARSLLREVTAWNELKEDLNVLCELNPATSLGELETRLKVIREKLDLIPEFLSLIEPLKGVTAPLREAIQMAPYPIAQVEGTIALNTLESEFARSRNLSRFADAQRQTHIASLGDRYQDWMSVNAEEVLERVQSRFLENVKISEAKDDLGEEEKRFQKVYNTGRRELEHEFGKSMRYKSIRDLVADETGQVVKDLKPIWLMSPLSVSDTLPLGNDVMDVVIFDEASQITLEEAIPSLFRVDQAIVVGDEKQLPPTDFFSTRKSDEDSELEFEQDGETIAYELESNSLLNHASRNLTSQMLGWHYRSRSESLISFSNWAFYQGHLLSVPDEELLNQQMEPIIATEATEAREVAERIVSRPISFCFMDKGVYEKRRNRMEAEYIAELVRTILNRDDQPSLGVVAFSEAQQDEIESALNRLAQDDPEFRNKLEAEWEREEDGQFVGLLVKNLENIQGDERDIIILSVCYGFNPNGKMLMNFGPINRSGGEKRLNVAFTRSKKHMVVVSSITNVDITNDYNEGANCLKNYLRYAECISTGDAAGANQVLHAMARFYESDEDEAAAELSPLARQLADALSNFGHTVDHAIGQSKFRCDLAVRVDGQSTYALGILCDDGAYYDQPDLLERELMKPTLLENFGWRIEHVSAKEWFDDRESVIDRLLKALAN